MHGLNQLIGYSKYMNRNYGNVYYRGVNGLFDNVLPSMMRGRKIGAADDFIKLAKEVMEDCYVSRSLHLTPQISEAGTQNRRNKEIRKYNSYRIEALLQHYSGYTRFLDIVDNHWVALWMGLQKFVPVGEKGQHCGCIRREIRPLDLHLLHQTSAEELDNILYTYILLIAVPFMPYRQNGIYENNEFVMVDLRQGLPSTFLRPHAQHALVVRRHVHDNTENTASYFDMAGQVTGILRVRIDRASDWIGHSELMTAKNLFPSPAFDQGYNTLLKNDRLFANRFRLVKYY